MGGEFIDQDVHAPRRCGSDTTPPMTSPIRRAAAELANVGFYSAVSTAWLAEGLLLYLAADDAARLRMAADRSVGGGLKRRQR